MMRSGVVRSAAARENLDATLDHLGENVTRSKKQPQSRDAYLEALRAHWREQLPATVSIKLTQFGLDLIEDACLENVRQLAAQAKASRNAGRDRHGIDGLHRSHLRRGREIARSSDALARVIQAYLMRSAADIERLNQLAIPVRLCKGAYDEPPTVAFAEKREVDRNYVTLMKTLLDHGDLSRYRHA